MMSQVTYLLTTLHRTQWAPQCCALPGSAHSEKRRVPFM
ncbi:unnamed protein product, partial [Staurois parvus]